MVQNGGIPTVIATTRKKKPAPTKATPPKGKAKATPSRMEETFGEIYKDQRPRLWKDMIGQRHVTSVLQKQLKAKKVAHTILFSGPSGVGKTTMARILAAKLNGGVGSSHDIKEMNCAGESRGIDTVRDMAKNFKKRPFRPGGVKVFILDECFHADTKVRTTQGWRRIADLRVGDSVYGIDGYKPIEKVFQNRVALHRVLRVDLSNGRTVYCSEDHKFLTARGWVLAKHLEGCSILSEFCYPMTDRRQEISDASNAGTSDLSAVSDDVSADVSATGCGDVQQELRSATPELSSRIRSPRESQLRGVSKPVHSEEEQSDSVLLSTVRRSRQFAESEDTRGSFLPGVPSQNQSLSSSVCADPGRNAHTAAVVATNAIAESYGNAGGHRDYAGHADPQRYKFNPARESWREWEIDGASGSSTGDAKRSVDLRTGYSHATQEPVSNELQGGHWSKRFETGYRGRWEDPSKEVGYLKRCQEDEAASVVRVDRVAVYQRGRNESDFDGVIGNSELLSGFAIFYDLQVAGHPSYHAEGVPVHNCHALTKDAQDALLKLLEDTPSWVYVILCSTHPDKISATLRTRASVFKCESGTHPELVELVQREAKRYEIPLTSEETASIASAATGSHRKALVILNSIRYITDRKERAKLIEKADESAVAVNLAKALLESSGWGSWDKISGILKQLKGSEDPESIRWTVLSYMTAVALNQKAKSARLARCVWVLQSFSESVRDCGFSGLVTASVTALSNP